MKNVKKAAAFALLFALAVLVLASAVNTEPGRGWEPDKQLTMHTGYDWNPSCAEIMQGTTGTIWFVWGSNRMGNFDIWCNTSSNGGASWSGKQLTTDAATDDAPSITQTSDGRIWVVFYSWRSGNADIYYMTSSDGGANWSSATQLTTDPNFDLNPSIVQLSDGTIFVAWQSDRIKVYDPSVPGWIPQDDIYYKTSSDGGAQWSLDKRLTIDPKDDVDPSVTQTADGKLWIAFASSRLDPFQIYYTTSSDGGANWSTETQLTTYEGDNWAPSITQTSDGTIWVMFHSKRGVPPSENWDIYYKLTSNGGADWSSDKRLTDHQSYDVVPSIIQTVDGKIWVFFASIRTGNYDIWYKTLIVHDVAITSVTASPTTVYQGEIVTILVGAANEGIASEAIETFTVTLYCNSTAVGTKTVANLAPGANTTVTFSWNTTNATPGNYTISAKASTVLGEIDTTDNVYVDGKVRVKIVGDVNGDGVVDIFDALVIRLAYWSMPGDPNWVPEADLNQDGVINSGDAILLIMHFGETQ